MASGYTNKLNLCLWEGSDPVLREEFNENHRKIEGAVDARPMSAVGAYSGTGTSGASNPMRLTFDFTPEVVIIVQDHGTHYAAGTVLVRGQTLSAGIGKMDGNNGTNISAAWEDNAVRWYAGTAYNQFNGDGAVYFYAAFGKAL